MKKKASFIVAGLLISLAATNIIPTTSIEAHAEESKKNCAVILGRENEPFPSISKAVESAKKGDTIKVYPGKYTEKVYIENDDLTIVGEEGAVICGGNRVKPKNEEDALLYINGSNISVSNLEFTDFVLSGPSEEINPKAIEIDEGSKYITISDCKIHDMGVNYTKKSDDYNAHGIIACAQPDNPIQHLTIQNCELYNLKLGQSEALVVNGNVTDFHIVNNYIHNCDNIAIDAIGYEQTKEGEKSAEKDRAHNGEICNNTVSTISSVNNISYGTGEVGAVGIYVDGGYDVDIFDNYVADCDIGIEVSTEHPDKVVTGVDVHDNVLVRNNGWAGISIGGSDIGDNGIAAMNSIRNNTVYNTANACLCIQYTPPKELEIDGNKTTETQNIIENNIFIATDSAKVCHKEFEKEDPTGINTSNNIIRKNMSNKELNGEDNSIFDLKGVSSNKKTVEITTPDDLSGFGAKQTKFSK